MLRPPLNVRQSPENGHLVLQDSGLYAVFQTSLPRQEAEVPGILGAQLYTYARIIASGWKMARTCADRHLIPVAEGAFDVQLRQSFLVVPEKQVASAAACISPAHAAESALPAEKLFEAVARAQFAVGSIAVEACGTYEQGAFGPKLTVVDATGGYSIGLESMQGLVDDEYLAGLSREANGAMLRAVAS